jgi:hypothetical protein
MLICMLNKVVSQNHLKIQNFLKLITKKGMHPIYKFHFAYKNDYHKMSYNLKRILLN